MLNKRSIAFLLLISLLLSLSPSQAQIVHEDPDHVPVHPSYNADRQLAVALEAMFGSLDDFVSHMNASDFSASKRDIELFTEAHADFSAVYQKVHLSGSDMEAIAAKLEHMDDDLWTVMNSSEALSADLDQYRAYASVNDMESARQLAGHMQRSGQDANTVLQQINANATDILKGLDRTSTGARSLENSVAGLNGYTARVNQIYRRSSGPLGNANLALTAGSGPAGTYEHVFLTATLTVTNATPAGRLINFYVDSRPIGSAVTGQTGTCSIDYFVNDRSFNGTMLARAELDPRGDGIYPAVSNPVAIARRPEPAYLTAHVNPRTATFADSLCVYGTLAGTSGLSAAGKTVNLSIGGIPAGNVMTAEDGSFTTIVAVGPEVPAGECGITASYDCAPDSALLSAVSPPCVVIVSSTASQITLDPPLSTYRGGDPAVFNGSLASQSGIPAMGANISIFAGDALIGTCQTDGAGRFSLITTIPYEVSPGDQGVFASFDSGKSQALAAVRSTASAARFETVKPEISVHGVPLLLFPGDELDLDGTVTANGRPIDNRTISFSIPGALNEAVMTDEDGDYELYCHIPGSPGIFGLSTGALDGGLLSTDRRGAGIFILMPFSRTVAAVVAIIVLLIVVLVAKELLDARRRTNKKPAPQPLAPLQLPGEAPVNHVMPVIGDALGQISRALSGEKDRTEAVLSTYLAARRILHDVDPTLPSSATPRELCRLIARQRPSLSAPLNVITRSYEGAAFRHVQPTDEEVGRSLKSLREIIRQLYRDGGATP